MPVSDRELRARADLVVHGIVVSSSVAEDALGRPETVIVVTPLEVLKGDLAGDLVLHQLGGTLPDGRFFKMFGRPEYQPGHEVVVFAIGRPEGDFQTAELLLGKFEVEVDERGQSFAIPALSADENPGVTVRLRAKIAPDDGGDESDTTSGPRELESFLRALRSPARRYPVSSASPQGKMSAVVHSEYIVQDAGPSPKWANLSSLWRWNNGASAVWTLDGQANISGGGTAEAAAATQTWDAEPNSAIAYSIGAGGLNPIHLNALSSPCGWTTCLAGGGVIGCGGPGGGGTNTWRGETYGTITNGEVWLRSYCIANLFSSVTTQAVLTHELGHTMGLGHSDQSASPHDICRGDESLAQMRSSVQNFTSLGTDDSDAVRWLYGDGGNSCNAGGGGTAPAVTTSAASGVGQSSATLNGSANPNGASTTTAFEYGKTLSYGNTAAAQTLAGSTSQAISAPAQGLSCNTLYHFRATGTNATGTTFGQDATFTTSSCSSGVTILTNQVPATNTNTGGHEIGMRFTSSQSGTITALRFWKAPADSGTHTGRVWSDSGALLASVVFTGETASGWQEQALATPLTVTSGVNYRVSYNVSTGYSYTNGGLASPISNPPLTGVSGCYNPSATNFPNNLINYNYFADVRFQPSVASVTVLTDQVPATNTNTGGHEIGMRFTSSQSGTITALRFWKAPADTGTHTARVWSDSGTLLASVVFTGETASGWQEQALATPLAITSGVNYRVSYNVNTGYSYTNGGLASPIVNSPLTGLSGCYNPTAGNFPNNLINYDYFADIRFQ